MDFAKLFRQAVRPRIAPSFDFQIAIIDHDDTDTPGQSESSLDSVSGLALVLNYCGANGVTTHRAVTCRQVSIRGGVSYLSAFCHHRRSLRTFRIDRIEGIFDPATGEDFGITQVFFDQFRPDRIANSGLTWGLPPQRRADLIALITALVFVARCDQEYHPLERDCLETIFARFWLRLELPGEPDIDDLLRYVDRLSPDGEAFWLSVNRLAVEPNLAGLLRYGVQQIVEADGVQHKHEFYLVQQIEEFLTEHDRS